MKRLLLTLTACIIFGYASAQETLKTVVNTLKERIVLMGYAQTGYTYDDELEANNTFDVKRIIFMADGKITDEWSCFFMYNFAGGGSLVEIYTDYKFLPWLSARLGQFKTPYTIESPMSPTTVELINCYSQATNYLAGVTGSDGLYGATGGRDIGFMVFGNLIQNKLSYQLAVMNGQGVNINDRNKYKDIAGSLLVNPVKWLSVGGSFVKGKGNAVGGSTVNPDIKVGDNYRRDRWSLGTVVETKPVTLRAEYLGGIDGSIKSDGFYVISSFHVMPKLDLIASYDYLNRNKKIDDKQTNYVAGIQYWFYPRCRLQAQYTFRNKHKEDNSNLFQAQIQVRF